jgi:3-oxoacyl-[acyl-carrier-protein] synthase III
MQGRKAQKGGRKLKSDVFNKIDDAIWNALEESGLDVDDIFDLHHAIMGNIKEIIDEYL